jgi:hypothetical protein
LQTPVVVLALGAGSIQWWMHSSVVDWVVIDCSVRAPCVVVRLEVRDQIARGSAPETELNGGNPRRRCRAGLCGEPTRHQGLDPGLQAASDVNVERAGVTIPVSGAPCRGALVWLSD